MLVIWEPMYPGDARAKVDPRLFRDPRVTSFWDPEEVSGRWFGDHRLGGIPGVVWDAYYAFGPAARWDRLAGTLVATGAPIIGATPRLQQNFVAHLRSA
jgi:hypothetical protein